MRTSVTLTRCAASVSSWTSPRMRMSDKRVAHLFADAKQADAAAFGGFDFAHSITPFGEAARE